MYKKKSKVTHNSLTLLFGAICFLAPHSPGKESAILNFELGAEFEVPADENRPESPLTFGHPGGSAAIERGDWDSDDLLKWATKTVPAVVNEGEALVFSCSYQDNTIYEPIFHMGDYYIGSSWMKVVPPAWATRVIVYQPATSNMIDGFDDALLEYTKHGNEWFPRNLWHPEVDYRFLGAHPYVRLWLDDDDGSNVGWIRFETCESCSTCAGAGRTGFQSPPSVNPGTSGTPTISAPLPFGNECCDDLNQPTSIRWNPTTLASATSPDSIFVNSFDLFAGTGSRFPNDLNQPIQQLKVGDSLGVAVAGTNTLTWRVYDATGVGAPNASGEYPLTKADNTPLPVLDETIITQENASSVLYECRLSGVLVNQSRITHDGVQNSWQTENIEAGSRERLTIAASGSGWLSTSEGFEKNSSGTWKLVRSDSKITETISGMEVVLQETQGGETVATHGYYPDGRKKWTVNGDGSWKFFEYDTATGNNVYSPYGDEPFRGIDWNPSLDDMTGIRCDSYTETGSTSMIESVVVGSHSQSSTSWGNYDTTMETYSLQETSRTTSVNTSEFVFEGFRGRTLLEDDGRGVTTLHEYTRGTVDANGFTASANGSEVMEIVTRGDSAGEVPELQFYDSNSVILHPSTIGAKFPDVVTRELRVYDAKGRTVCSATQVLDGSGYALATQTVRSYTSLPNNEGEVITEARDGRVVATSSSLSDGTWEENVDQSGSVRTTVRDLLGRVTTETSPGPEGSTITRSYIHDGLTTTITTSGGGLSLSTSETRDMRGRVVSSTDQAGIVTGSSFTDGGRTTTITRPGGVTETTTNYLDGRFKQRSGSGVIREFASYELDEATGYELTKHSSGPAIFGDHGARWTETTTDKLGRTVSIRRPGPPNGTGGRQADVTESYSYSPTTGKLASIVSSARPGIYQLMEEDLLGTWSASGTATHSGPLVANSSDRFSTTARTYEKRNGRFWEVTTRSTFVQGSTPVSTSTGNLMWVLDGEESEYTDAASVTSTRTTIYDPTHKTAVTSSGNALQGYTAETTINGFLKKRSIPGAAQDEAFGYDGLGREIRHTDVRNASSHTFYNNLGQVEKVVDHLGQFMSYTYYPANHQSAGRVHTQTDAAGKSIETAYDTLGRVFSTGGNATYPVSYTYDGFGERETLTTYGTETAVTTWVNDPPTGLLLEKKYHGQANGVKYAYLGDGRPESRTWRRGATTTYRYDSPGNAFGDLDTIDYPVGTPDVSFSNFDRLGRPGTVTEGGNVTTLTFNSLTGETSTIYDGAHGILPGLSVVMKSPNSGRPGGYTLQKSGISTPLLDVDYGYDDFNRFQTIGSGAHTVTYGYYPGTGVLRESTHTVAGGGTPRIETRSVDLAGRTTGVVTTVPNGTGRRIAASAGYMLNDRGLREKLTREDGTSWNFGYNDRSEVTSGLKKLANGDLAAGLQFGYQFDGIGNREWAKSGGDPSGENLRTVNYTPNALNQYSEITTPGSFDVLVRSQDAVGVEVNGSSVSVTNQGGFHRAEATATNTDGAWTDLNITSPVGQNSVTGHHWLQPAVFSPGNDAGGELNNHDDDGNLTDDGRWTYTWDAENRLASVTINQSAADLGAPKRRLEFFYDWQGRRIAKKVLSTSSTTIATASWNIVISDERFAYNGWNTLAVFDASGSTLTAKETILWGLDLSGTLEGAGGVSGLLAVNTVSPQSVCYPAFDGNGNIIAWTATNGDTLQRIDYDPFGNIVTKEGAAGFEAPAWGFSTKYQDHETGLLYYGYRFYDPVNGRWPSRDSIGEVGGVNLFGFVRNNPITYIDLLGQAIGQDVRSSLNKSLNDLYTEVGRSIGINELIIRLKSELIFTRIQYGAANTYDTGNPGMATLVRGFSSADALHELSHSYYDRYDSPYFAEDEQRAGVVEATFAISESLIEKVEKKIDAAKDYKSALAAARNWSTIWSSIGQPSDWPVTGNTAVTKRDIDFIERHFKARIKCSEVAKILNKKLSKNCIFVNCDAGWSYSIVGITTIGTGTKGVHPWIK